MDLLSSIDEENNLEITATKFVKIDSDSLVMPKLCLSVWKIINLKKFTLSMQ